MLIQLMVCKSYIIESLRMIIVSDLYELCQVGDTKDRLHANISYKL